MVTVVDRILNYGFYDIEIGFPATEIGFVVVVNGSSVMVELPVYLDVAFFASFGVYTAIYSIYAAIIQQFC